MIKLFVSDLDGTLLNGQHVISPENAQAIRDLQAAGIEFLVATGRSYNSAAPLFKMHDLSPNMITLNGATFFDSDGSVKYTHTLDPSDIKEILDYTTEHNIEISIMTPEDYYLGNYDEFIERIATHVEQAKAELDAGSDDYDDTTSTSQFLVDTSYVHDIREYDPNVELPICKIMILSSDDEAKKQLIDKFDNYTNIDITSSSPDNLEITSIKAQKGLALEEYAVQQGYTINQIVTIGDSLNDRSMLQMATYSFAMENASPQVKSLTNYEAPHHNQNGVATVIYDVINGKYN